MQWNNASFVPLKMRIANGREKEEIWLGMWGMIDRQNMYLISAFFPSSTLLI